MHKFFHFFDKLEDKTREELSHFPILYAVVGGVATVLFWRGVWHTADFLSLENSFLATLFSGPGSVLMSVVILLITGLMVSVFVGDRIILSGLKKEKKLAEKTESEVRQEGLALQEIHTKLEKIEKSLHEMREHLKR